MAHSRRWSPARQRLTLVDRWRRMNQLFKWDGEMMTKSGGECWLRPVSDACCVCVSWSWEQLTNSNSWNTLGFMIMDSWLIFIFAARHMIRTQNLSWSGAFFRVGRNKVPKPMAPITEETKHTTRQHINQPIPTQPNPPQCNPPNNQSQPAPQIHRSISASRPLSCSNTAIRAALAADDLCRRLGSDPRSGAGTAPWRRAQRWGGWWMVHQPEVWPELSWIKPYFWLIN